MPAISGSAPGKSILFGEHAVVYHRPAIAVPVTQVQARAVVLANPLGTPGQIQIDAPDIDLHCNIESLSQDHPLVILLVELRSHFGINRFPAFTLRIKSTIPIAAGLGSGAAVSVAVARAVSCFLGYPLPNEKISEMVYLVEKTYHGTPSGIDNTVITFAQPIYFVKEKPFELLQVAKPITLVIGDCGVRAPTGEMVAGVRQRWEQDPAKYEKIFDEISEIVMDARMSIENGELDSLGRLMTANHQLLQQLAVSTPLLDQLIDAAIAAGAEGAKVSGAGGGGNMIALSKPGDAEKIAQNLHFAGAARTIITEIKPAGSNSE